jgi:hypothetical protein
MLTIRNKIMAALLIIASCLLTGAYADCDFEGGELFIDFEGLCGGGGCGDHDDCDDCDDWDDHDDCDDCDDFDFDFWWD